jgi:hypothetical protein
MVKGGLATTGKGVVPLKRRASGSLGAKNKKKVPTLTRLAKKKAVKSATMLKYTTRSKFWVFSFPNASDATEAARAFRKQAKNESCQRLDAGSMLVQVVGHRAFLTWASACTGKTVYGWINGSESLKSLVGKGKNAAVTWGSRMLGSGALGQDPWLDETAGAQSLQDLAGAVQRLENTPVVAAGGQGYPGLSTKYGMASLTRTDWFGTSCEPNWLLKVFNQYGFLILRGYLPKKIVASARSCVEAQFKTVMGSLTDGFATVASLLLCQQKFGSTGPTGSPLCRSFSQFRVSTLLIE